MRGATLRIGIDLGGTKIEGRERFIFLSTPSLHSPPLHDDPRWPDWLEAMGLSEEQLAAIPLEVTLPR